jgi:hypothetical protein
MLDNILVRSYVFDMRSNVGALRVNTQVAITVLTRVEKHSHTIYNKEAALIVGNTSHS